MITHPMKRELSFDSIEEPNEFESKRANLFQIPTLDPMKREKRCNPELMEEMCKRPHIGSSTWPNSLSESFIRTLAYPNEGSSEIPHSFIQKMEEDAYRQSLDYRNQALTIYRNPKEETNAEESEEEGAEDLGIVSYYYPPLESSNLMEVVPEPDEEPESETVNYQQQLMETGMLGVPPMNWNL